MTTRPMPRNHITLRWRTPALLLLTALVANARVSPAADVRPNILWISIEDASADLGCYGDEYAHTPTIDQLAAEGTRFTNVYGVAAVCAVNRSGIITGMYPTTLGTQHMRCRAVPPPYVRCFPEYLRAAGYYCTNNVKTDYNFDNPVTAWDESSRQAHWRNRPEGKPFFSVINLTTTHESQVRLNDQQFAARTQALSGEERHDPAKAPVPAFYPDTPVVRRDIARYYDLVTAVDKQIAAILDDLAADGLADETIVFFWTDHGRGLPRYKRWLYDSGLHVPLIVRWPGELHAGTVNDELVSFIDLAPTVLSVAGVNIPEHMQGRAFLGGARSDPPKFIFAARDRMDEVYDLIRAVRDQRFKYIRNYEPYKPYAQRLTYMEHMPTMQDWRRLHAAGELSGPPALFFRPQKPIEELYDTDADPDEIHNLADDPEYANVLARVRAAHETWRRETNDLCLIPETVRWEQMRPGGEWQTTATPTFERTATDSPDQVQVTLDCPTPGASIAYALELGNPVQWRLYSHPFTVPRNQPVRAKAIRLGYRESAEIEVSAAASQD